MKTRADGFVFRQIQCRQPKDLDALFILNGKDMLTLAGTEPIPFSDMLPLPFWMELPHLFDQQALHYRVDSPEGSLSVRDAVIIPPAGQPAVETLDQSLL